MAKRGGRDATMGRRDKRRIVRYLHHPAMLISIAAALAVALAFTMRPPAPRGLEAAPDEFSAERAAVILRGLLAESAPHVAGSPLNREIRGRIENFLRAEGYESEVQSRFHCNPNFGNCAHVENVIAVKQGADGGEAVLLTAHYDSSWAGPGAADDGAGTAAVLEIARMAAQFGNFRNDLIFLITDGEELGLLGAHAFATEHPLFEKVAVVINLEARGVTGPSSMFETGEGNRSLIRILSRSLDRPVANSLAYEVYKRMPNDTDYSVYKARGVQGLNFAFTGGVALYHSGLDDLDHLDYGSLQHHGQNAWSMVRALADRDISNLTSREDAAYIDVFGRMLWHYPVSIASGVTMVLTVLLLIGIAMAYKRQITAGGVAWAVIAEVVVVALLVGGAWLLNWPLGHLVSTHPIEHPSPWVARFTLFALCALVVWIAGKLFAHRINFGEATLVCWVTLAGLAFYLDFNLPAASFVLLVPMAAFFLGMLLDLLRWRSRSGLVLATVFGLTTAAYIALYHFYVLDVVLPFDQSHFKVAPLALLLLPILPAWFGRFSDPIPDWRPAFVIGGVVILTALLHQLLPGFTEDRPRGMNLVYREAQGAERALLYVESPGVAPDPVFTEVRNFFPRDLPARFATEGVVPNANRASMSRPAVEMAPLGLPAATVTDLEAPVQDDGTGGSEAGWLRFTVQSPPGTEQLAFAFPGSVKVLKARVEGVLAMDSDLQHRRGRAPRLLRIAYPGEPLDIELLVGNAGAFAMAVTTRLPLPSQIAAEYADSWPEDAQPIFQGSRAEVVSEVQLRSD